MKIEIILFLFALTFQEEPRKLMFTPYLNDFE